MLAVGPLNDFDTGFSLIDVTSIRVLSAHTPCFLALALSGAYDLCIYAFLLSKHTAMLLLIGAWMRFQRRPERGRLASGVRRGPAAARDLSKRNFDLS